MKSESLNPLRLADCFSELARLFGAPLETTEIAALVDNDHFDALDVLAADPRHSSDLRDAIAILRSFDDAAAAASRLNAVFCRLFLGLGPTPATLPIESAHCGDGRLFQEPASFMSEMLAGYNLHLADGFAEAPDHLAIELSLLEQLIRLQASLTDIDQHAAISTLRHRLGEWTPAFAEAVAEHDPTGFYVALARLLARLVKTSTPGFATAA